MPLRSFIESTSGHAYWLGCADGGPPSEERGSADEATRWAKRVYERVAPHALAGLTGHSTLAAACVRVSRGPSRIPIHSDRSTGLPAQLGPVPRSVMLWMPDTFPKLRPRPIPNGEGSFVLRARRQGPAGPQSLHQRRRRLLECAGPRGDAPAERRALHPNQLVPLRRERCRLRRATRRALHRRQRADNDLRRTACEQVVQSRLSGKPGGQRPLAVSKTVPQKSRVPTRHTLTLPNPTVTRTTLRAHPRAAGRSVLSHHHAARPRSSSRLGHPRRRALLELSTMVAMCRRTEAAAVALLPCNRF